MIQTLYNGVKFPCDGPDLENIEKIDLGALPMIHRMMANGMRVDLDHFARMEKILTDDMDSITEKVHDMTGYYINLDSGDQKSDLLFKKLGIKQARPKMTKSGDRESVEDQVLKSIQHEHPVVPLMQEYMEYSKLKGTYVAPMPKLAKRVGFDRYYLYPNLGSSRVPSGRLNCKEPNLLAMPNRTERGRQVCEGFIADEGWVFLSVDESQIEPRVVAHRSGDERLRNIYFNEEDIYSDFATSAFKLDDKRWECKGYGSEGCDNHEHMGHGWHYPTVDKKKHRFPAKTCILAWLYDVSGPGLLEQMPIVCKNCQKESTKHDCRKFESLWNENNCQDLINAACLDYEGVVMMRKMDHDRARKHTLVWDDWGRILHATAVRSVLSWVVSACLREIANFPIQSDAQGTVKITMARVDDEFEEMGVYDDIYRPHLQIHDELLGTVRKDYAEEVGHHIASRFEQCVRLEVPIKASMATADVWGKLAK